MSAMEQDYSATIKYGQHTLQQNLKNNHEEKL